MPCTLSCKHNANAQKRTKERKDETLNKVFSLCLCNNLYIIEYFKEETRRSFHVSKKSRYAKRENDGVFCHCIFHSTWCGRLRVSDSLLIWPSVLRSSSNRPIIFWILSLFVACVEPGKGWKINSKKQIPHYFSRWFYITKYQTTKLFWFFVCFGGRYDLKIHVLHKLQHKSLTFHHLHILQGKFPQKLVFTWSINHAGSRVSEEGWREKQERCNREKKSEHLVYILFNTRGQYGLETVLWWPVCITYRLMELRLNEPDFLLRVVQMIRSLKRKRERSFFPPTVFYRETGTQVQG